MNPSHINRSRISLLVATLLVASLTACAPQQTASEEDADVEQQAATRTAPHAVAPAPPPASVPAPVTVTVYRGTEVDVTLSTDVGSETSQVGDSVSATTLVPVVVGDRVAIPAGSTLHGQVTNVMAGTKGLDISEKGGVVVLSFNEMTTPQGWSTPLNASITRIASSKGKTAGIIGGSAAGGALLGKILGDSDKDIALGAVLGGGIGTGIAAGTKGKALNIPAGTQLTVVLDQDLDITDRS